MANNQGATTRTRKAYVRKVTDKRREQNRRAQKAYRERLKKKLEDLEGQAASGLPQTDAAALSDRFLTVPSTGIYAEGDVDRDDDSPASPPEVPPTDTRLDSRVINIADAFVAAGDLPFGQGSLSGIQFQVAPETPTPEPDSEMVVEHTHADYGDIWMAPIWAMPTKSASPLKRYPTPPGSLQGSRSFITLTSHQPSSGFPSPRSAMADPYMNHMRLVGEANIEASIAIGLALKISRNQYLNDHPSHFPGCYVALNKPDPRAPTNSISPITVPYKIADTFMQITPRLQAHLECVKPPIRPTPAQLLNPHPAYLDCIVFPYFREHAVKASADGILDHGKLFTDIMHGGLVCWGGMSGLSNRHGRSTKSGKRDMRETVAWSTRSWEAKKWFLKKWTWLIGTEEEEEARGDTDGIWKGSRWWWTMRGEEDSDDEDEEHGLAGERIHEVDAGGNCL
ncbi:hypothetical protein G647_05579 [Cladophialophora carrionii CBS 160.54]|uniref:BZIP domain-containing protein n=1 Tax=Cladophialophora carrionii CBS 160.54 TaxID=1279043 RepID=V9DBT2_9EURO|nr:uncharacterized protein G647_05579 [Cladophialophora carrionii CBS 160.54]ETI23773.1 hypothetical protein G647_05579 [Cladophialophora carrionii CBS 160.54]